MRDQHKQNKRLPGISAIWRLILNVLTYISTPAKLTLFNLSYQFQPAVLKNNQPCTTCTDVRYDSQNLSFNITGFSSYSSTTNSKLTISATNRLNNKLIPYEQIYFQANYTKTTSNNTITSASCAITLNNSASIMTYNTTLSIYEHNTSFTLIGTYPYNITCNASTSNYETLNTSSTAEIQLNTTLFTLSKSLEGMDEGASLALADINNDTWADLIVMGYNSTKSILNIYYNNASTFNTINQTTINDSYYYGTVAAIDYDNDGDLDVVMMGRDVDQIARVKLLNAS